MITLLSTQKRIWLACLTLCGLTTLTTPLLTLWILTLSSNTGLNESSALRKMARSAVQRARGTTAQHAGFIGLNGEITINTDTKIPHVHDGVTPGGFPTDYTVNVKRFGAKGDGVTDDTAAINAAINAVAAGNGSSTPVGSFVKIPAGVYNVTTVQMKAGVTLSGDGIDATILRHTTTSGNCIHFDCPPASKAVFPKFGVENLKIWQVGKATSGAGIGSTEGAGELFQCTIRNVWAFYCYKGVSLHGMIHSVFDGLKSLYSVHDGLDFAAGYATTETTLINCYASNSGNRGFVFNGAAYVSLINCGCDVSIGATGYYFQNCTSCAMYGCASEDNGISITLVGCHGVTVDTFYCHLVGPIDQGRAPTNTSVVKLDGAISCRLTNLARYADAPALGTYAVVTAHTCAKNVYQAGYQSSAWPSDDVDRTGAFTTILTPPMEYHASTARAYAGTDSFETVNVGRRLTVSGVGDGFKIAKPHTPPSADSKGDAGTVAWDSSYLYVCVAPNKWRRVAHSSW